MKYYILISFSLYFNDRTCSWCVDCFDWSRPHKYTFSCFLGILFLSYFVISILYLYFVLVNDSLLISDHLLNKLNLFPPSYQFLSPLLYRTLIIQFTIYRHLFIIFKYLLHRWFNYSHYPIFMNYFLKWTRSCHLWITRTLPISLSVPHTILHLFM
jgi:hypothetical protein